MYFYDHNYKLVRVPITEKISHPLNSHRVYKTSDGRCLKRFRIFPWAEPDLELEQRIQNLQLKHFFEIQEYLFNKSGDYRAFLMPYYESSSKDILTRTSDYLTDNFSEIFDSFDKLSLAFIEARDTNLENSIFTDQNIILIDTERYCDASVDGRDTVSDNNYSEASWLLFSSLIKGTKNHSDLSDTDFYKWFRSQDGRTVCSDLANYKYPIEYMRKVKQKIK